MTRFGDIRLVESIDSTNRYLLDEARAGGAEGIVVVADHQTAGQGRLGRTWEARPGQALLASILLRPAGLAPGSRHLATAAVAMAAADACRAVAGVDPAVKWPNDLLIGDGKLAGVLAVADGDAIVVGIGLNLTWAPPGAAALNAGRRGELLAALLEGLERRCDHWDQVAAEYQRRCATVGCRVRVVLPDRVVIGRADSIDERGRLRVIPDGGDGPIELSAGDVVHLRS